MTTWSAPGKLFLFGEYAVLAGAWSVVAAVDRRVTAELRPGDAYTLAGAEATDDLPNRVLHAAGSSVDVRTIHCDVRAFFEREKKLGLGSSAASCVAMAALALNDVTDRDRVFEVAGGAHRSFQHGRGSHADAASSVYGGLIAYRLLDSVPPFPRLAAAEVAGQRDVAFARVKGLAWPEGARARAYWLGEPASSVELIGRVEPAVEAGDAATLRALESIASSAEMALAALSALDGDANLYDAVTAANGAMVELGAATGAPVVTPAALDVFATAEAHGIVGKMSGAGGGDFVLLVGPEDSDWSLLEAAHPGLWLDLGFDVAGVSPA
jgi:phosphomevalonate kinase